jgi:signal transduction histidine kinase
VASTHADAVRAQFAAESRERALRGARTAFVVAVPLIPFFGLLDLVIFPEQIGLFFALRLACVTALLGVLMLLRWSDGRRHPHAMAFLGVCVIVAMLDVMIARTGGVSSVYYAGLNLVMVGAIVLVTAGPVWASGIVAVTLGGYVAAVVPVHGEAEVAMLVTSLFFLGSTGLLTLMGSVVAESFRWRELSQRTALREALQHKSEFMAKMSHELRTPLHVIIGYADILLEGASPSESRRLVERIRSRGQFLNGMISDLLDYAKIEAGKMTLKCEPVDVGLLVTQVASAFRPLALQKGVRFEGAVAALPWLVTDAQRVEQVLTNLVGNAVKFTHDGAVRLTASRVTADAVPPPGFTPLTAPPEGGAGEWVLVSVSDTGPGIRDDQLGRLATDFEQLDGAADHGGTGLGLSISKRLAMLLGGGIAVQSSLGEGTTFVVWLPAADPLERRDAA